MKQRNKEICKYLEKNNWNGYDTLTDQGKLLVEDVIKAYMLLYGDGALQSELIESYDKGYKKGLLIASGVWLMITIIALFF